MASNVEVKITADVAQLQAQFALAKAESNALTAELNKLARQAQSTGMTDTLAPQLLQAAEAAAAAKANLAAVTAEMKGAKESTSILSQGFGVAQQAMGAFGVTLSAAAVVGFATHALESAAALQEEADKLGLTTDALQVYNYAARDSGVSTEDADMFIQHLMATLGQMEHGDAPAAQKAIEQIGETVDELGRDHTTAIYKFAAALKEANLPAEQTAAILKEIGGRNGQAITAMIDQMADGYDKVGAQARAANQVIGSDQVKEVARAKIAWEEFWQSVDDGFVTGTVHAGEWLNKIGEARQEAVRARHDWESGGLPWTGSSGTVGAPDQSLIDMADKAAKTGPKAPAASKPPEIGDANKEQEIADKIIAIHKQTAEAILQGEQQLNSSELALGQETLAQFNAQELSLAKQKYNADLAAQKQLEATGKSSHAEYLAAKGQLDAEYANRVAQIGQQAAEKQKQIDATNLQEFLAAQNTRLSDGLAKLDTEYRNHQISADEKAAAERNLTQAVLTEDLKRLDADNATAKQGTEAYANYLKQRQGLLDAAAKHEQTITDQLSTEQQQRWTQLANAISSSFNSALDKVITKHQSLKQAALQVAQGTAMAFLHMGEEIVENQLMTAIMGKTIGSTGALGQIGDAAAVGAANAFAATAAIPYIGPEIAPGVAASTFADIMSFAGAVSLDVGAWEIPHDMPAMLHKGEMVQPKDFATGFRENGGRMGGGGGDNNVTTNYSPTIHAHDTPDIESILRGHANEIADTVVRGVRTGLPMRPSGRTMYAHHR